MLKNVGFEFWLAATLFLFIVGMRIAQWLFDWPSSMAMVTHLRDGAGCCLTPVSVDT
jgi:hypothetical protein